jgi:hypothetical protein
MKDQYAGFIRSKSQIDNMSGFEPLWMPEFLFDFQQALVGWAIRKGRAAIFADCGLGKTPMQLVWAENIIRKTNRPVLIVTPLAVGQQTVREATKFGIQAKISRYGKPTRNIAVTNYERLHYFDPADFGGVVCDESGAIKHFDAKRTAAVTEFLREIPYRLLCTATAAPNDYIELGTSAEALGEMGFQDMVTRFFKKENSTSHLGWGRTQYRMKGHAEHGFWRWVCSWARACRKPSDLGFDDQRFILPELKTTEHSIIARKGPRGGGFFDIAAITLQEQRDERRRTIPERCEKVAELVNKTGKSALIWCHLNSEGDLLEKLIPDSVQISGSDSEEKKEQAFVDFVDGKIRDLITKPVIGGWGLNFQHCAHETFFPSHSFEQFYQGVRRCWRFGQTKPVQIDIVTSGGEKGVLQNLKRKEAAAELMFTRLVELMNNHLEIKRTNPFTVETEVPAWL